jgi:hypothetical protein
MPVRDGMDSLIERLRGLTVAGTADYTLGDVVYWTDEQLQDALDDQRRDVVREPLRVVGEMTSGGSLVYHDYYWRSDDVEGAASGTEAWKVQDSTGATIGTANYTINPRAKHIRFTADTRGTAYVLSYRTYDLYRAAAEVWEEKAGHAHARFDLKTDNHDMKRSQIFTHCMQQAQTMRRRAKPRTAHRVRTDTNAGGWG